MRDIKYIKLTKADEPLVLRDEERFHNVHRVFDLGDQGGGRTTWKKEWGGEDHKNLYTFISPKIH